MSGYTIAAIPTRYRGRQYRSRLEARWAAFFDRLGWTHEYEPFDLGYWSPDFAITAPFHTLVEVKPLTEPDYDTLRKIERADGFTLLTRLAPDTEHGIVQIGWCGVSFQPVCIGWFRDPDAPVFRAHPITFTSDLTHVVCAGIGAFPIDKLRSYDYIDHTIGLWADACNAVQWEPKQ